MKLLLHIGCEKTGTTSLQYWLDRNAAALASHAIAYSETLGRPNNRRISLYGLAPGTPDNGLPQEGVHTPEQHIALQARIAANFAAEVERARRAGCRHFIISNEHLHSRICTPQTIARIHALLAPLFDDITILCSVRPQMDMCLSLASTHAREGNEISRAWIEAQMQIAAYYDFDALLRRWEAAFGRAAIEPIAFRRHPDTIRILEHRLGLTDAELPRARSSNEALDYRTIMLTNALAAAMPAAARLASGARFRINELPVEQKLSLDRASAQALQAQFVASNAALAAHWPQITADDLTPDWSRYPEQGNIDRLDDALEIGPIVNLIIDRMALESAFDKARFFSATAEREASQNNFEQAIEACRKSRAHALLASRAEQHRTRMEGLVVQLDQRLTRLQKRLDAHKAGQRAAPSG